MWFCFLYLKVRLLVSLALLAYPPPHLLAGLFNHPDVCVCMSVFSISIQEESLEEPSVCLCVYTCDKICPQTFMGIFCIEYAIYFMIKKRGPSLAGPGRAFGWHLEDACGKVSSVRRIHLILPLFATMVTSWVDCSLAYLASAYLSTSTNSHLA